MMNGAGSFEQRSFDSFPGCGRGMSVREAPASPPELCDQSAKCLHPNVVPISAEFQIPDVDRAHAAAELRKRAEETEQIHPINQSTYWNSLLIISACATSGHGVLIRPGRFIFANIRRCCSANPHDSFDFGLDRNSQQDPLKQPGNPRHIVLVRFELTTFVHIPRLRYRCVH